MDRITSRQHVRLLVLMAAALCLGWGCSGMQDASDSTPSTAIPSKAADNDDNDNVQTPPIIVQANKEVVPSQTDDTQAADNQSRGDGASQNAEDRPPAAKEEKIFPAWPDPKLVLVLTGRQHGYIEPCGCTGLANQKGGLARKQSLLGKLAARGWQTVALDVGNQVRRYGPQANLKFQFTIDGLRAMNYRAVALGPDDLRLSVGEFIALTGDNPAATSPFVSANVTILSDEFTPRLRIIEAGGKRIGVTSVLGSEQQKQITSSDVSLKPPGESLQKIWPQLEAKSCDLYVLLAHASLDESRALARQFPKFDIVVTAGGEGEPALQPEKIPNSDAVLVQVGTKGMYVGAIGVFDDADKPLRYERVPLDATFKDSPDMLQLLKSYQEAMKGMGLAKLGARPIAHPTGNTFVGSAACADCHEDAFTKWKNSPHADATDSLVHPGERSDISRHYDPECLSCHVTGWNPQKYFPYYSGYLGLEQSPLLHGSGCENCHGPGSKHVAAENGDLDLGDLEMAQLRGSMRLPLAKAEQQCMECHDLDNSPDFHLEGAFEKYWKLIEH